MANVNGRGVAAVDLGGTRLRVAVFAEDGSSRARHVELTPDGDPSALARAIRQTIDAAKGVTVEGAVVGVPGPVSYLEGHPYELPNLPAWEGHLSAQALASDLGLPVVVANDVDLGALGEHRFGAGRGVDDLVYITSGTGVGGAAILGGRLVHGRRSIAEVGWTTIDFNGPEGERRVEELGSGSALERFGGDDGVVITQRALAGEPKALAAFQRVAGSLAVGVMNLVFCFMPQRVVIGGGVASAGELLLGPIRDYLAREGPVMSVVPEVVASEGGDDSGLLGGLAFWLDLAADGGGEARPAPSLPIARP